MNHNEENHYFLSVEGAGVFFTVGHSHPSLMFTGKVLILIEQVGLSTPLPNIIRAIVRD